MQYIKAGAASMAGAWFIHWPVRGLYGPGKACAQFVYSLVLNRIIVYLK